MIILHETEFIDMQNKLIEIIEKYNLNIKNFKWEKLKSKNKVFALKEFLEYLFPLMLDGSVSIQVLIWNVSDSRHNVVGRDDIKNLSMMYYKLIKFYVKKKLFDKETLTIFPDRNHDLDWDNIEEIFINDNIFEVIQKNSLKFMAKKICFKESNTSENVLIQIADIFAGLGRTSYEDYADYKFWLNRHQQTLIPSNRKISNKQKCHFEIYEYVDKWAKSNKLRVSLTEKGGFYSFNNLAPLNFWLYEPQNKLDIAPIKFKELNNK